MTGNDSRLDGEQAVARQERAIRNSTLAARLQAERHRLGVSIRALAEIASVSYSAAIGWERGACAPNAKYWPALVAAGFDIQFVLTGLPMNKAALADFQACARMHLGESPEPAGDWRGAVLSADEADLIDKFRACDAHGKAALLAVCVALGPTPTRKAA